MEMTVSSKKLFIAFNLHEDHSAIEALELPEPIKALKTLNKTAYFSKDLAPILFNIADAQINGAVNIAGNAHAVVFRYATTVGQFEIAVPTLDAKRKHRDGTMFYALDRQQ